MRLVWLPYPQTVSGWIASTLFYIYLCMFFFTLISIGLYHTIFPDITKFLGEGEDELFQLYANPIISLLIVVAARYWAVHSARAALRGERARFNREAAEPADGG
jgi:hypothetical protein